MAEETSANLTHLLNRMLRGDQEAGDRALAELHAVLRRAASNRLRRERPDHLLETGGLVNEALLRLFGTASVTVRNRQHFVALVCLLMKRVLIDLGRRKDPVFAVLDESMAAADSRDKERFLAVEQVLARFERLDPESHEAFRLKTATGMTADEVAETLGCATVTVHRRLRRARTWLFKELSDLSPNAVRSS